MPFIKTTDYRNSTVLRIYSERDTINTNPDYQRPGGIWSLQKKQLLIDSILNDYDIPKLYFHLSSNEFLYAIIDGRQRLEAIWEFIEGKFPLADDFVYFQNPDVIVTNSYYSDIARLFPKLKINFDSYVLPIIIIESDDLDLIEDMFSRLNEAVPLNAAEKRNSIGGPMTTLIRTVSEDEFFTEKVKFSNSRYQHREVSCRLLFLLHSLNMNGKILDTKRPYLDKMTTYYKNNPNVSTENIQAEVLNILSIMNNIFSDSDPLLRSQSSITIFFLIFRNALQRNEIELVSREQIVYFFDKIRENRVEAEKDITEADYDLLEFERLSQQGTNDAFSIKERVRIFSEFLKLSKTKVEP